MKLPANVTRTFHKIGFGLKKHSPEILIVTGIAGVITSTVLACRATLKVHEVLDNTKKDVETIHTAKEMQVVDENGVVYDEQLAKKDLTAVYLKTGLNIAKLYAPAIIVGGLSITGILSSHKILKGRNLALAAAYATVDAGFKDYRKNVVERFGEELDRELKYNIKTKEVEEVVTNEDGTETTVKKTVQVVEKPTHDVYTRCFDETCTNWEKSATANRFFLEGQEKYANDKLRTRGYLTLNEVYEALGFDATEFGQYVGWVYDADGLNGDPYVDFGMYDIKDEASRLFINGHERSTWLNFNCYPIMDYFRNKESK